ncbi:ATP-binding cassette domain-containing protein [Reinekea marinisedimentorum]|uniref:ATP-binding protein Uup n=1 Tax=Reinekea marinisedimentorum TaxID=230495 RepID=A0A4R3I994_9GAMM|nr:ATP-binding cassette domain-containing protein [Reinekea marinisedimentorum]TCS42448.1 ATP-binding cassette subfamily F protein uup [Reinekea marinisedimentorum]
MSLIIFDGVHFAMGAAALLDQCSFTVEKGERIALVGRNGVGKSTLMRLIQGDYEPDAGVIKYAQGMRIGHLQQSLPEGDQRTVLEVVLDGVPVVGSAIYEYQRIVLQSNPDIQRMEQLQKIIEDGDGWHYQTRAETVISRLGLDQNKVFGELSGGWRRRVLLAQALVDEPDLLILDEPTNHLDIKMVEWLEELLLDFNGTLLFVSHDRSFIDHVATKIMDLDRGKIVAFSAPYEKYLTEKEHALEVETAQRAQEDKVLAREEAWIRQGIKARRTRNEGRVRALKSMRTELAGRRTLQGSAKFDINQDEVSGKLVAELTDVAFSYGDSPIIREFSDVVMRGDKIALIGPNGIGKSTLLKILLGELEPQSGVLRQGTKLNVAYFDQARMALDPEKTLIDSVAEGREFITIGGKSRHVISYLEDFLFQPERCRMKVRQLSGGETNRLLLARLFSQPANLLVLDEPTNDLDMDTLELLIDRISDFSGTVLLVSHDRYFIDQLATKTWAFEGNGAIRIYPGGYEDWTNQGGKWPEEGQVNNTKKEKPVDKKVNQSPSKTKKLSYKDQREFDQMPEKIEQLESEVMTLEEQVSDASFYSQPPEVTGPVLERLLEVQEQLNKTYDRWVELEGLQE